jgi:hypothetical protein
VTLPEPLRRLNEPVEEEIGDDTVRLVAGPRTDWFVDPSSDAATVNAPALVAAVQGDFMLAARVEVEFSSTFDAGVLVLWHDEGTWAKLCFEYSPAQEPMIVSVVTRDVSDDCNSVVVGGDAVWLRIARIGQAYAFHASLDGRWWQLVRHFRLGDGDPEVGFEAQSPRGDGCAVTFSEISFASATLADLRSGV